MNNSCKDREFSKWVAAWGNATSVSDREISTYSKDLTLRYLVKIPFYGNKVRLHFSNIAGTEDVKISQCFVAVRNKDCYKPIEVTFGGKKEGIIPPGMEIVSDETAVLLERNDEMDVSMYFEGFTQMSSGTLVTGPLSKAKFAYGNFTREESLPLNLSRNTQWFYFLNTVDVFTEEKNRALICYGDSITAQSWPDYLFMRLYDENLENRSVIRRAVCGTRILREYDCITYRAYGLKGEKRFALETDVAGADSVIIQHGINDIIHPVGVEVNPFRPWSDMPSTEELIKGFTEIYVKKAKSRGLKVYGGTLLPIYGWRTYNSDRDKIRNEFNDWMRSSPLFDGVIDFDMALRDDEKPLCFKKGFDSGDHLHPSEKAYRAMADCIDRKYLV